MAPARILSSSAWIGGTADDIGVKRAPDPRTVVQGLYRPPIPDHLSLLALAAARQAIGPVETGVEGVSPDRVGVVLHTALGPGEVVERFVCSLFDDPRYARPLLFSWSVANAAAGLIARTYGFRGPSVTFRSGAPHSVALDWLQTGQADAVICVGVDVVRPLTVEALGALGVSPPGGFVEGAAAVVLGTEEVARDRGQADAPSLIQIEERMEDNDDDPLAAAGVGGLAQLLRRWHGQAAKGVIGVANSSTSAARVRRFVYHQLGPGAPLQLPRIEVGEGFALQSVLPLHLARIALASGQGPLAVQTFSYAGGVWTGMMSGGV